MPPRAPPRHRRHAFRRAPRRRRGHRARARRHTLQPRPVGGAGALPGGRARARRPPRGRPLRAGGTALRRDRRLVRVLPGRRVRPRPRWRPTGTCSSPPARCTASRSRPAATSRRRLIELGDRVPDTIVSAEDYGGLKVLCERVASERFPGAALVLRCGLVVGPGDPTERFVDWPRRVARGGDVLEPSRTSPSSSSTRVTSARGRSRCWRRGRPASSTRSAWPLAMAELLRACADVSSSGASLDWVGDRFLLDHGVEPWTDLPLWLPSELAGFLAVDTTAAAAAGLRTRPVRDTVADVLRWDATHATRRSVAMRCRRSASASCSRASGFARGADAGELRQLAARPQSQGPSEAGSSLPCALPADVAQLVEHFTRNEGVAGSSPAVGSQGIAAIGNSFFPLERIDQFPGAVLGSVLEAAVVATHAKHPQVCAGVTLTDAIGDLTRWRGTQPRFALRSAEACGRRGVAWRAVRRPSALAGNGTGDTTISGGDP